MNDIILNTITIILTICIIISTILYLIDFIRWVKCREHMLLATKADIDLFNNFYQNSTKPKSRTLIKGKCIKCGKKIEFCALSE